MIESLKDLEKLLKLCRKQGVQEIKLGAVEIKLGDLPSEPSKYSDDPEATAANPLAGFPDGMLTPEQLMFYSAGGSPDDDPVLNAEKAN